MIIWTQLFLISVSLSTIAADSGLVDRQTPVDIGMTVVIDMSSQDHIFTFTSFTDDAQYQLTDPSLQQIAVHKGRRPNPAVHKGLDLMNKRTLLAKHKGQRGNEPTPIQNSLII